MELAEPYVKVTCQGGPSFICKPNEVAEMTSEEEDFKVEEVMMTQTEFDALPEFQG